MRVSAGPGEPFVSAAGILGLMACWRAFYCTYLDVWNYNSWSGGRLDRISDMLHFRESLRSALFVSIAFCIVVQFLRSSIGEENIEIAVSGLLQRLTHF